MLLRQTSAGRSADLHRLELGAVLQTAADIEDDLPKGASHGHLDQTCVLNGTGQGEGLRSRRSFRTDGAVPVCSLKDDLRNVRISLHVVQNRRLLPQALLHGTRRFHTRHASVTLDGSSQSRTLAADERARASVNM